jgi:tetratricopeptide (TPR) repeat protein
MAFSIPPMFYRSYFASFGFEYFEYRAYLPIIGILLISGYIIKKFSWVFSFNKKIIVIFIPLLLIYSTIAFIHSKDFVDPISFFTSAINANSKNAMALSERGVSYYDRGDNEKAQSDLDNSIRVCPIYPVSYFNRAVLYSSSNDHYHSEYFFSQALKYDTSSQDVNILGALIYIKLSGEKLNLRKFEDTKTMLKKAIKIYPENSKLYNNLGLVYYNTAKFDSAYYAYNKAIEFEKNVFTYYDNRGMASYHLSNFHDALQDFNRVLDLKPDFKDSWGSRGMVKLKLNDFEGAVYDLTKAIDFNPNEGAGYYFRGVCYSKLNRIKEAKKDWEKSVELGYMKAKEMLKR